VKYFDGVLMFVDISGKYKRDVCVTWESIKLISESTCTAWLKSGDTIFKSLCCYYSKYSLLRTQERENDMWTWLSLKSPHPSFQSWVCLEDAQVPHLRL
jgi:hypothetical protein